MPSARATPSSIADRRTRLEIIERRIRTHELKQRKATTMAQVTTGSAGSNRLQLVAWMEVGPENGLKKDLAHFEPTG